MGGIGRNTTNEIIYRGWRLHDEPHGERLLFDAEGQFASTIDYHEQGEFAVAMIRRVLATTGEQTP